VSERTREWRIALLSTIGLWALRVLAFTWRYRVVNPEVLVAQHAQGKAVVRIFWHGHLLAGLWALRYQNVATMISEHGDGEIIGRAAQALGCRMVRGSTSRGAARALLSGAREIEAGYDLALTPDGPRGPAKSVAPGTAAIAQRTGAPILPIGIWASRAWHLSSWDSLMIPQPFARVNIAYGEPLFIDSDAARKAAEATGAVAKAIEAAIARATPGAA
jgi:lysophospholipid acyltransferase (LPLAT)-like uncharacterized protein